MKKIMIVSVLVFLAGGCGRMYNELCTDNRLNLSTLSVGMEKHEVMSLMEHKIVLGYKSPYETEDIELFEKDYQVLHYVTSRKAEFTTPLFFYEGKLVGWGRDFLKGYREKSDVGVE